MFGFGSDVLLFIALGIALVVVEILTLTFYAIFLAVAAFVVALCLHSGLSLTLSLCIGGALAVICSLVFQKNFQKKRFQSAPVSPFANLMGQKGIVSESIDAQSLQGAVVIDGTTWRATSDTAIAQGENVVVSSVGNAQDMTLGVKKI